MLGVRQFLVSYGNEVPAFLSPCVINPKAFFTTIEGLVWKKKLEEYCEKYPHIQFNMGKFKAHIITLAVDYYRNHETKDIGDYITYKTVANRFELEPNEPGYEEKALQNVALTIIKLITVIFLNIVTLGFASYIWNENNNHRLRILKEKKECWNKFNELQNEKLPPNLGIVNRLLKINHESGEIEKTILICNQEKNKLQNRIDNKQKDKNKFIILRDLLNAKSNVEEQTNETIAQKEADQELKETLAYSQLILVDGLDPKYEGLIPARYVKKSTDDTIRGKFIDVLCGKPQRDEGGKLLRDEKGQFLMNKVIEPSEQGKWVNNKKTMEDLLDSVFNWVNKLLLEKANEGEIDINILSMNETQKIAFIKYMVFLMIDTAAIDNDCTGIPHLELNQFVGGKLIVDSSIAYRVKNYQGDNYEILYKNQDGWTPKETGKFPYGLDPLGAKWIMVRIQENETYTGALLKRVLKPFLKEKITKDLIEDEEIVREIELVDRLIEEIATALKDRYASLFNRKIENIMTS